MKFFVFSFLATLFILFTSTAFFHQVEAAPLCLANNLFCSSDDQCCSRYCDPDVAFGSRCGKAPIDNNLFKCTCKDVNKNGDYSCSNGGQTINSSCQDKDTVCSTDSALTQKPEEGPLKEKTIQGIRCVDKERTCLNPRVPCTNDGQCCSLNCKASSTGIKFCSDEKKTPIKCACKAANTSGEYTCDDNGTTIEAQCKETGFICISDSDKIQPVNDGELNGKVIQGINCQSKSVLAPTKKPPLPPPPSPPCDKLVDNKCAQVLTAFGPIPTDPSKFIQQIYGILLAGSGAIAVLLFMRAGYKIQTSQGNPEALKEGTEQATATAVGLLFLILAFVLLQIIAGDLLKIPGITP